MDLGLREHILFPVIVSEHLLNEIRYIHFPMTISKLMQAAEWRSYNTILNEKDK